MAAPTITFVGNLAADPQLRFTPSGKPVLNGRVLNTPRKKGADGNWEDQPTIGYDWSLWGSKAEAAAELLSKGDKVIVYGALRANYWEKEGKQYSKVSIDVYEIGAAVKSNNSLYTGRSAPTGGSDDDPWSTNGTQEECPF